MTENRNLTIHLYSFGYHISGIPSDPSGHGGGFVFDCRGLINPGRDAHYKQRTGEDAQVQEYLERFSAAEVFIEHAYQLVSLTANQYKERGFDRLMVSFGCTGGQHRSVYCALKMAEKLREAGFTVELNHLDKPSFS